jgi:hypothetical protein
MLFVLSMLAAAESASSPLAMCQASLRTMEAAIASDDGGRSHRAGKIIVSAQAPFCSGWTVVTIFSSYFSDGRWIFRKATMDLRDSEPTIMWANSRTCPQIFDALESLERLPIRFGLNMPIRPPARPKDDIPRIPNMMMDGVGYTVQTYSPALQPSGYTASVKLSSNAGEVAAWAKTTLGSMATCWTNDEPVRQPE